MITSENKVTLKALLKRPSCFLAYGFGSGLAPVAPGTFGTLAALPIYWLMQDLSLLSYLTLVTLGFILGIWFCQAAVNWLGKEDPSAVVWDEIIGYLVTMIAVPQGWHWMLLGFVLFRIFDIWKPWPIRIIDQRVHGGFGVMLDDLFAGVLAAGLMQLTLHFI